MDKEIELAIVFADVVGSTKLYELLGDVRARDMVGICIDVMRAATDQNHGTVIKTMETVAIRIGCNFGPVVLENRDIFGSAVHTANRMTSQAKAGQIITTATMVERLSSDWRASVRQIDIATLKGRSSEVALFEVLWQTEDITSMVPSIAITSRERERANKTQRLRLRYQGQEVVVDDGRANITIGRAEENDLVVKGNLISRLHARVEINRNKFMLIDQSTNGTFVLGKDGEEAFVRRDSMQIRGEGLIGLGKAPDSNSSQVIRYTCEE